MRVVSAPLLAEKFRATHVELTKWINANGDEAQALVRRVHPGQQLGHLVVEALHLQGRLDGLTDD